MKKILFLAASVCIASAAFSQINVGVQVSGNLNSATFKADQAGTIKKDARPGFGAGIVAEIPVSKNFSLLPSLNFAQKSARLKMNLQDATGKMEGETTVNQSYIELPVNVVYSIPTSNGKFYFGAGPSVGYGIGGKTKSRMTYTIGSNVVTQSEEEKTFDKNGGDFKKFAVNANVLAGLQFNNKMFVNAGAYLGLNNQQGEGTTFRNFGAQVTFGYFLWSTK